MDKHFDGRIRRTQPKTAKPGQVVTGPGPPGRARETPARGAWGLVDNGYGRCGRAHKGDFLEDDDEEMKEEEDVLKVVTEDRDSDEMAEDCDTDLEDLDFSPGYRVRRSRTPKDVYMAACRKYDVTPSRYFLQQITCETGLNYSINMNHRCLGPDDLISILVTVMYLGSIDELNLANNTFGEEGVESLTELMCENVKIKTLDISHNQLGSLGAKCLGDILRHNDHLTSLSAAGNDFHEKDAFHFVEALKSNFTLTELNLSHNAFREDGGFLLGHVLATNFTVQKLDLSWNHLRLKGATAIAAGLKENETVKELNLSWNGFSNDGAKAMGEALRENSSLVKLNLTNNRINAWGAAALAMGLKVNNTLQILQLNQNPLTTVGAMELLSVLRENKGSAVVQLDMEDVSVTYDLEVLVNDVKSSRPLFRVKHGEYVATPDLLGQRVQGSTVQATDPFKLLMVYCQLEGLRLWDLFSRFDKDGSLCISREEFVQGIRMAGLPIPLDVLEDLVLKLDADNDGEIDFGELLSHQKKFKLAERRRQHEARERAKHAKQAPAPAVDTSAASSLTMKHADISHLTPLSPAAAGSRPNSAMKNRARKVSSIVAVANRNRSPVSDRENMTRPPAIPSVIVKEVGDSGKSQSPGEGESSKTPVEGLALHSEKHNLETL